jgi:hypothetical protein
MRRKGSFSLLGPATHRKIKDRDEEQEQAEGEEGLLGSKERGNGKALPLALGAGLVPLVGLFSPFVCFLFPDFLVSSLSVESGAQGEEGLASRW